MGNQECGGYEGENYTIGLDKELGLSENRSAELLHALWDVVKRHETTMGAIKSILGLTEDKTEMCFLAITFGKKIGESEAINEAGREHSLDHVW